MTTPLEDQLRDAYQAAAQAVRPETIRPGVQHYQPATDARKRSTMFAPLAAAAAVVVAIGAAVTVPHLVAGSSRQATPTSSATASTSPFLVEVRGSAGNQIVVQREGTRDITAAIALPHGPFTWDAVAAAGGRTFVAAATTFSDREYTSAFYRFTLSADGKPGRLAQIGLAVPGEVDGLAASQDGQRIAYTAIPNIGGTTPAIVTRTGDSALLWTVPGPGGPGRTGLLADGLSLTADGSDLSFITLRQADTVGPVRAAGTVWRLPTGSAPGSAVTRGHEVTTGPADTAPFGAVLSADGQTMYVLSVSAALPDSAQSHAPQSATLSAYSTADGALLRTIHTWTGIPAGFTGKPGMAISGGQLLVWDIDGTTAYQVDLANGATKQVWIYGLTGKYRFSPVADIAW
jgi:hypothetical protein